MISDQGETIVAVSTPLGKGALAVIRLSGPQARALTEGQFHRPTQDQLQSRLPTLGEFWGSQKNCLDRVLVTFFQRPDSFTGEDVVEISCHGSPVVTRQIVETMLEKGARLAEPGEFTQRAFLNGKMNLAQAEGLRDLIESRTAFQAKLAYEQLEGSLSLRLAPLKEEIVRVLCHIETSLEFVEDDVEPQVRATLVADLEKIERDLQKLEESFALGRIILEGATAVIVGKPNVGKSLIFNSLLEFNRAIVTDFPGTTRDVLAETIDMDGIPTRLVDTAGIREAKDRIERLGVEKSLESVAESDVVIFVLDGSRPFQQEDWRIWELVRERTCFLVVNKEDLTRQLKIPSELEDLGVSSVTVSALKGTHLQELRKMLSRTLLPPQGAEQEAVPLTDIRHKRCIQKAREHLQAGIQSYKGGLSEEFPLYDFRKVLGALGQITGETTVEDLLDQVFSTFCIGK